ncbi:hypothetical protein OFN63_37690, partial [Escherichia coli]|nr:hypothetical protein [Escherichia coli]
ALGTVELRGDKRNAAQRPILRLKPMRYCVHFFSVRRIKHHELLSKWQGFERVNTRSCWDQCSAIGIQ